MLGQAQGVEVVEQPSRVVTIRMTRGLHDWLKRAAHRQCTSMNLFCVGALQEAARATLGNEPPAGAQLDLLV